VLAAAGAEVHLAHPLRRDLAGRAAATAALRRQGRLAAALTGVLDGEIARLEDQAAAALAGDPGYAAIRALPGISPVADARPRGLVLPPQLAPAGPAAGTERDERSQQACQPDSAPQEDVLGVR